jgi:hypothetical protein
VRRVLELGICVPQELRPWDATVGIRVGVSAWGENTDSHCEQREKGIEVVAPVVGLRAGEGGGEKYMSRN